MTEPVAYWVLSFVVGLAAFPIAVRLFWRFPDGGAGLAFALGVTLAGYGWFLLRTVGVLQAGAGGALLGIAVLGLVGAMAAGGSIRVRRDIARNLPGFMVATGLFTFLFFGFVSFRSYLPDIEGTEQPMDLMYLSTAMESEDFPPEDAWLAGHPASYYYFGYVQAGMMSSAASVSASTGYNLHLGFVFAASGTAIASVAAAGARWLSGSRSRSGPLVAGGAALVLLLFAGSLSTWFEWPAAHGAVNRGLYDAFGLETLHPGTSNAWYPTEHFWWFDTSRVIPGTITEFPAFSFVLGDLHPHLMSIPLVLLLVGLSAVTWRGRSVLSVESHRRSPLDSVVIGLLLGALAFQNAWDLITFTALFGVAVAVRNLRVLSPPDALTAAGGYLGPLLAVAAIAYFPWYLDFSSQAGGIYPYVGAGTRPVHVLLQYGPVLVPGILFAAVALRRDDRRAITTAILPAVAVALAPVALWLIFAGARGELADGLDARGAGGWLSLLTLGGLTALFASVAITTAPRPRAVAVFATLATFGTLLLLGAELFFVRDVFFGSVPRLNTVFKLSYQAWILLATVGGVAIGVTLTWRPRVRAGLRVAGAAVAAFAIAACLFSVLAVAARTEGFSKETEIDGFAALARNDPDTYALTRWIAENTARGSVIIEGSGRRWQVDAAGQPSITDANVDYRDGSLVSARTGRPASIGWYFHEVQWRGDSPANTAEFARRQDLLDSAYTAGDDQEAVLRAMNDSGAEYLVLGRVELDRYPRETLPRFDAFLDVAFAAGDLRVYRLPRNEVIHTS